MRKAQITKRSDSRTARNRKVLSRINIRRKCRKLLAESLERRDLLSVGTNYIPLDSLPEVIGRDLRTADTILNISSINEPAAGKLAFQQTFVTDPSYQIRAEGEGPIGVTLENFIGDITVVDLTTLVPGVSFGTPSIVDPTAADLILPEALGEPSYAQTGVFYVAPHPETIANLEVVLTVDGSDVQVLIDLETGISQVGGNAVSFGGSPIEILRLQQRLRYFGYPGPTGQPIVLNGQMDNSTQWSIGLFNAAMTGSSLNPSDHVRRDFINEIDTPKWIEIHPATVNSAIDGIFVLPNVSDGSTQSDRFASEMYSRLLSNSQNLPIAALADDGTADVLIAQQDRLEIRTISGPAGGSIDSTGDHHAGLEIDIETPASNSSQTPFFATREIDATRYVKGPNDTIVYFVNGQYLAAAEGTYLIDLAVQVQHPTEPEGPLSAWNNRATLLGIREFLQDNVDEGYDLTRVRKQLSALLTSGVTAGQGPYFVESIKHNDPRTWTVGTPENGVISDWSGDGQSGRVVFQSGVNGVFQAELVPPVRPDVVDPETAETLLDGLDAFGQSLASSLSLTQLEIQLPLIQRSAADLVPLQQTIQHGLYEPLSAYFIENETVSSETLISELLTQINLQTEGVSVAVDPVSVSGGRYLRADGEELRFNLTINASQTWEDVELNFGDEASDRGIRAPVSPTVDVTGHVSMGLSIGIDYSQNNKFFIRVDHIDTSVEVEETNRTFDVHLGFLGATAEAASFSLDANIELGFTNELGDARRRVFQEELLQSVQESMPFEVRNSIGSAAANIPVTASIGTFTTATLAPEFNLLSEDAFSTTSPVLSTVNFGSLDPFANVDSEEVDGMLDQVRSWLATVESEFPDDSRVYFVKNETLGNLFDLDSPFQARVNDQIHASGQTSFQTAQQLVAILDPVIYAHDYDPVSGEFWIEFNFNQPTSTLTRGIDFSPEKKADGALFDNLELPLVNVSTVSTAEVTIGSSFDLTFGIDLDAAAGPTESNHFFVEGVFVGGTVDVVANGVAIDGKYGLIDIVSPYGTGNSSMTVDLAGLQARRTLDAALPELTAEIGGDAEFDFYQFVPAGNTFVIAGDKTANFTWSDLGDLDTRELDVPDEFACYQHLAYVDFVAALRTVADFFNDQASHATFTSGLPLIDKSLSEFATFAANFDAGVTELETLPERTIQKWEATVEDLISDALVIDNAKGEWVDVSLDFSCAQLQIAVDLHDVLVDRMDPLNLTVDGYSLIGGTLQTKVSVDGHLIVGIDITTPSTPRPYIEDSSEFTVNVWSFSDNLNGSVGYGPLSVSIQNGRAVLDADGIGNTTDPATYTFGLYNDPIDHRYYPVTDSLPPRYESDWTAGAQLPLFFPTPSDPMGGSHLDGDDPDPHPDNWVVFQLSSGETPGPSNFKEYPDVASELSNLELLDLLQSGLTDALVGLADEVDSALEKVNLPLVGNKLKDGIDFTSQIIAYVDSKLSAIQNKTETNVQLALFEAFTLAGLDLEDISGPLGTPDGTSNHLDIVITTPNDSIEFELVLIRAQSAVAADIQFDIGLPKLAIELETNLEVETIFDFVWNLKFGLSEADGFYLKPGAGDELSGSLTVSIPDGSVDANFGSILMSATDNGSELSLDLGVDLVDPTPGDGQIKLGELLSAGAWDFSYSGNADLKLDLETHTSMVGFPSLTSEFIVDWKDLNSDPNAGEFVVEFRNAVLDLDEYASKVLRPMLVQAQLALKPIQPLLDVITRDIYLLSDLGELGETFERTPPDGVQIADLISYALQGTGWGSIFDAVIIINDLVKKTSNVGGDLHYDIGDFRLTDQADPRRGSFNPANIDPDLALKDVRSLIDQLGSSTTKEFFKAALDSDFKESAKGLTFPLLEDPSLMFQMLIDSNADVDIAYLDLPTFRRKFTMPGIQVPILPPYLQGSIGVSYDYGFRVDVGYDTRGLRRFAASGVPGDLADGLYIEDWDSDGVDSPEAWFKIDLEAFGGVDFGIVEAEIDGYLRTTGPGDQLQLDLRDNNGDGKVRFGEIRSTLVASGYNPFSLFDASGKLEGGLTASLYAGYSKEIKVGYHTKEKCGKVLGVKKCVNVPDFSRPKYRTVTIDVYGPEEWGWEGKVILDLAALNVVAPPAPNLGEIVDGVLFLNVGPRASQRGDSVTDGNESMSVRQEAGQVIVSLDGLEQSFTLGAVTRIEADAGNGNDQLTFDNSVTLPATLAGGIGNDLIRYEGSGNTTIVGGSGDDRLFGGSGIDIIYGGIGKDRIEGNDGNDQLFGGDDPDQIFGGDGNDVLEGGTGNDQLDGQNQNDVLRGGTGNDRLSGGEGNDQLFGDSGDDRLVGGGGSDQLHGGADNDSMDGGDGSDSLWGDDGDDRLSGGGDLSNDSLYGGAGNDYVSGQGGHDTIDGGDGDDLLLGGEGNDTINGGAGDDSVYGAEGNDVITDGSGLNTLSGEEGDDVITGGIDADSINGGDGNDLINAGSGDDSVNGGDGDDTINGEAGKDYLYGGAGADILRGGTGDDVLEGHSGDDQLEGNDGDDILEGGSGRDQIHGGLGNDFIDGGSGGDFLYGEQDADDIDGGSGNDYIEGGSGDDILLGGSGNDSLYGNDGADLIRGGSFADLIDGGDGPDRLFGDAGDDILLGGEGGDELDAGSGDDHADGGLGDDIVRGGPGNDHLIGGWGADLIFTDQSAGAGDQLDQNTVYADLESYSAVPGNVNDHNDTVHGSAGQDTVYTGPGNNTVSTYGNSDTITADSGDDILSGGSGSDLIIGGWGADTIFAGASDQGGGAASDVNVVYGDPTTFSSVPGGPSDHNDLIVGDIGIDTVYSGPGNDVVSALAGNDFIEGYTGADIIDGGDGDDVIYGHTHDGIGDDAAIDTIRGGNGNDVIYAAGGNDNIYGDAGNDQLFGENGDDFLDGGDGPDLILGGFGNDSIHGGAGADRIEAEYGDDTVTGGSGDDLIFGGPGQDNLSGDQGRDYLDGGYGVDIIRGGSGNDTLSAGFGIGNQLFGDSGNDTITGSSDGAPTDPDFFDMTYFGDVIDAGEGNDTVFGLGGADLIRGGDGDDHIESGSGSDYVLAGDGDDWVFVGDDLGEIVYAGIGNDTVYGSHVGDDQLFGEEGNDDLFGQGGNDFLRGGSGDDLIDGGGGTDDIDGEEGDDELLGGGGVGDLIRGGIGNDIIRGSDDGADIIYAGAGRDTVMAGGGNDQVYGDEGDDILHGGDGDDLIVGGPGRDLITGDADHDVLYGHNIGNTNDDNLVDYVYGDFGTNANEPNSGQDQIDGGGGNDQLFGEGDDDRIFVDGSGNDLIDYGSGETATPFDFVTPVPTPDPNEESVAAEIVPDLTLPTGVTDAGRWAQFAGSATGSGLGDATTAAIEPDLVVAGDGTRYMTWVDARHGNHEIYVAKQTDINGWQLLGDHSLGGVSATMTSSRRPTLAIDGSGAVVVAWTEFTPSGSNIRIAHYDAVTEAWENVGPTQAITSNGTADNARLVSSPAGLVLAWIDRSQGVDNGYLSRFDGNAWQELAGSASGNGVTNSATDIRDFSIAVDATAIAVAWTQSISNRSQIYVLEFDEGTWSEIGGSASGDGVSDSIEHASLPTLTYQTGELFLAWVDSHDAHITAGPTIRVARQIGTTWSGVTPAMIASDAVATGLPRLASGGGQVYLAWTENIKADIANEENSAPFADATIAVTRWNGTAFDEVVPGDGSTNGIHYGNTTASTMNLEVNNLGQPFVIWQHTVAGVVDRVYLRGDVGPQSTGQIYVADGTPGKSITELLAANSFTVGDTILVTSNLAEDVSIDASDAGVALIAVPGVQLNGNVTIEADNVVIQRMTIRGEVTVSNADHMTIRESDIQQLTILGSDDVHVTDNDVAGQIVLSSTTGALVEGNRLAELRLNAAVDTTIRRNRISDGANGIAISSASSGEVLENQLAGNTIGLRLAAPFDGLITRNEIWGGVTGILYGAAATLSENSIHDNHFGIVATVTELSDALGFVGQSLPNVISNNDTGVSLTGRMRGQRIIDNTIGVIGYGILGGNDLNQPNEIVENEIGVQFDGEVRYNHIARNNVGINARSGQLIAHNVLFRNATAAVNVVSADDVRVIGNTMYAPAGDNVYINSSKRTEVQNNVMWSESGYNIYVANSGLEGFYSDYNLLHSSGTGTLIHWIKDFSDILDWQEDVYQYDLHSLGSTALNPDWSEPRFVGRSRDDFHVFELVGGQRFSSPPLALGNALIDVGRSVKDADDQNPLAPYETQNWLANPSFENGLTGWLTGTTAETRTSNPSAHDGGSYFSAGETVVGSVTQTVDLSVTDLDFATVDAGDLRLRFGGRIQSADEVIVDQGQIQIEMLDATSGSLGTVVAKSTKITDRWELVGGDVVLIPGTRYVRFTFTSTRQAGNTNDAYLDNAFVRFAHIAYGVDAGAHVASPLEVETNESPSIALRFPELYTDWQRDTSRTIRWNSYNNYTDVPVRIDLFQDGPNGPMFVTNIVDATPDDGQFDWTPANSGVDYGTHGLIIQISRFDNQILFDRSTETFSVPENTTTFYVNDAVSSADQYTSSVGDNRNTGRTPDAPKPYPNSLLRIYSLGPNDALYADTGNYELLYPIVLSGTVGIADDEGFVLTGPDLEGSEASLSFALFNGTESLIQLDDADLVTINHLSLSGGFHGLHVTNDSTGIVATHLVASGHTDDGIRIDKGSLLAIGDNLTVSDNGGHGLVSENSIGTLTNAIANGNTRSGITVGGVFNMIEDAQVMNNGESGLVSTGTATLVSRVEASANGEDGIRVQGADTHIQANIVSGNQRYGIYLTGSDSSIELNQVSENLNHGIYVWGYETSVSGNVVWGHNSLARYGIYSDGPTVDGNIVFSNANGLFLNSANASSNRVYANTGTGIYARRLGELTENVVYSNDIGIRTEGYGSGQPNQYYVGGNLIYDNEVVGLSAQDGAGIAIDNNTIYQPQGDGMEIVGNSQDVRLRNNIVIVDTGVGIIVDKFSQPGFDSNFNLLRHDGSGLTGRWGSLDVDDLAHWRIASLGDSGSLSDAPLFVDIDGTDDSLGFVSISNDGRDDDFHLSSSIGRFTGSLAPVRSEITGLPVDLPVTELVDELQSPAIDRGDDSMAYDSEPSTNGGYVNLGVYGNTPQASKSPAEFLVVVSPNGDETWPIGRVFDISWRSAQIDGDTTGFVDIDLIRDSDEGFVSSLASAEISLGHFQWTAPSTVTPADDYRIRITHSDVSDGLTDQSDVPFEIKDAISVYYVNDGIDSQDEYTTAAGNDANDGLSPATPKATLRSLLESGTLQPGDTIVVDHGVYAIDTNLLLGEEISGVTIQGPSGVAAKAILDRDNTNSGSYIFEFAGADDVTITGLTLKGAHDAVYAHGQVDSDRIEIIGNTFVDNNFSGVYAGIANWRLLGEWNIEANTIYGSTFGVYLTQVDAVVQDNVAFNNNTGFYLDRYLDDSISLIAISNEAYQNQTGIAAYQGAIAEENVVYANETGVFVATSQFGLTSLARSNVAYDNDIGISLRSYPNDDNHSDAISNKVFSNRVGIQADSYSYQGSLAHIKGNLVYGNQEFGIAVYKGQEGSLIAGNTIYQSAGSAIGLLDASELVDIRNNIFSIVDSYTFDFAADSENVAHSDFNLFDLRESGKVAKLSSGEVLSFSDWTFEFGEDTHSRAADPLFVDLDGSDDALGFNATPLAEPIIIDNGDAGFFTTGQWDTVGTGYQGNSLIATDPSDRAVWSFDNLTPGETYTVATTVGYSINYDYSARFEIFTEGRVSSQQAKNQSGFYYPEDFDFIDLNVGWNRLGYYQVGSDGTLRVELTGSGLSGDLQNADAIRIEQIVGLVAADDDFHLQPTSPAIDGGDPSFDASNEPSPNGGRVNLGVFGGTTEATISNTDEWIHLIDPAGSQRYRAGRTMPIRWQSETWNSVDILLYYADGYAAGVSEPVFVIANELAADGQYDWLIPEIPPFSTDQEFLIEIVEIGGTMPRVVSDVPLLISSAGNTFYVNDASTSGDEYSTEIGNNANLGTNPDQPMASLAAVLNRYDLYPGDIVYVDAGYYPQFRNLRLDESLSGVTIQGPVSVDNPAVIDRRNGAIDTAAFEFTGADNVTIANLSITGGDVGIAAWEHVDSNDVQILNNTIYDNRRYGVLAGSYQNGVNPEDWIIAGNRIYGHEASGIWIENTNSEVRGNIVLGNLNWGIYVDPGQNNPSESIAIGNNVTGSSTGIFVAFNTTAEQNVVHGNAIGISVYNWTNDSPPAAIDNVVYNNETGIELAGLRYQTQYGTFSYGANAIGNRIFSNRFGIQAGMSYRSQGFTGTIRDNLIYSNTDYAIQIGEAFSGAIVEGNTIQQSSGNAIHITELSLDIDFRNNIFSVEDGFVFQFETDSQVGHTSDYNLFDLGTSGKIADWGWAEIEAYEDWFYEAGFDPNGLIGAPLFVDPDGADSVLGYHRETLGGAIIMDDGDVGFSATGNWSVAGNGYLNDSLVATAPTDRAQWEFTDLTPGGAYQIAATVPYVNYSPSDARFNIYADGLVVGAARMNQSYASDFDFFDASVGWDELGVYRAGSDGILRVELRGGDGQYDLWSTADAVRLEPVMLYSGEDDNFHLHTNSIAIDAGDPASDSSAEPTPSGTRINLGAYGGTSQATTTANAEILIVDSPNGKDRYNVGQTIPIHWASEVDGPVDISIYDAASFQLGISTPVLFIAENLISTGQFNWMVPGDGSIAAGVEYLIEVRSQDGTMPSDLSESFLIASIGSEYFINDDSADGDVYTTAVGINQNSGKSVDQPMASLAALLRVYELVPGDTVFVDSGHYGLLSNIVLDERFNGVTIRGPGSNLAVLNRQIQEAESYVFEFAGADDVTIQGLSITGAQRGINAEYDSNSHRVQLIENDIYANSWSGISIGYGSANNDIFGWSIRDNRVHSNGGVGGIVVSGSEAEIIGNEIFGNSIGIDTSGFQFGANSILIHDNQVYENLDTGIVAYRSTVIENKVFGNATGIFLSEADANDNFVYQNTDGIIIGNYYGQYNYHPDNQVRGNRVFANTGVGITFRLDGHLVGNYVYSNSVGILADNVLFFGEISNNLIYANTNQGIVVQNMYGGGGGQILNNTVHQRVGDALRIQGGSKDLAARNNILIVDAGNAVSIAADSQVELDFDWNLLQKGTDPNAHLGLWGSTVIDDLTLWQTTTSLDANSLTGDPGFLDIDGADNVLGFVSDNGGYDGGRDDNFYRTSRSIAIDRGDSWSAPSTDITGAERADDPGTANLATPDYVESIDPDGNFADIGTGYGYGYNSAQGVILPFEFEFYGQIYGIVTVSAQGYLHLGGPDYPNSSGDNDFDQFLDNARIAPLWDNLIGNPTHQKFFYDESVADQVTVRWNGLNTVDDSEVNFSVTLFADGQIRFDYGAGNTNLTPTVGISAGDGLNYVVATHDGASELGSASSLLFALQPGFTDIGAYEFQGNSNDTSPPVIVGSSPAGVHAGTAIISGGNSLDLQLSEPLNEIDANASAAYSLLYAGMDGTFGNLDDSLLDVAPSYQAGSTTIRLTTNAALSNGRYRLTLFGQQTLHDQSGLLLDGDGDSVPGGNYVREFSVEDSVPPIAFSQTVTTAEDEEVEIALIGDDGNTGVEEPLIFVITELPSLGTLSTVAGGSPITADQLPLMLTSPIVFFTPSLNSHNSGSFAFRVRDDDGLGEDLNHISDPATVTINVTAVNDPPTIADSTASVSEFASVGLEVTTILVEDPDLGDLVPDTHTLALIGGNDDGAFGITNSGVIFVADPTKLDFELTTVRSLVVEVTDAAGETGTAIVDVNIVDEAEAQIESVSINGNDANNQRSSIDHLVVQFNSIVDFDFSSGGPFRLIHQESGTEILTTAEINIDNGKTRVTLRFLPGDGVDSLGRLSSDGNYHLMVLATKVSRLGFGLDGNGDGHVGDDYNFGADSADNFFRFFGDNNGDGAIDISDFAVFRRAYERIAGEADFDESFDHDGDGDVDLFDFANFRMNYGSQI